MEEPTQNIDTPVVEQPTIQTNNQQPAAPAPSEPSVPSTTEPNPQQPEQPQTNTEPQQPIEEEEVPAPYQPLPQTPPLDFSQLPVNEDNLIDPNALAQHLNSWQSQIEQNTMARTQQIYAEQEYEKGLWNKAYEKYPELKTDKDLRDMVHNARLGRVTELLSTERDPSKIKLPTPAQTADTLFKRISAAKGAGFTQANQNTTVQQSAVLETPGKPTNSGDEALVQAQQNINSPNQEVRTKARSDLLKKKLGWG